MFPLVVCLTYNIWYESYYKEHRAGQIAEIRAAFKRFGVTIQKFDDGREKVSCTYHIHNDMHNAWYFTKEEN